jgi:hypothetical protein
MAPPRKLRREDVEKVILKMFIYDPQSDWLQARWQLLTFESAQDVIDVVFAELSDV